MRTVIESQSDELAHYGVLGMKWGVRKDPQKAYQKASAKTERLQAKADKKHLETEKQATSSKNLHAIQRGMIKQINPDGTSTFAYKSGAKGKAAYKANKKIHKAATKEQKAQYKVDKWQAKVDAAFKNLNPADYNLKSIEAGMKVINNKLAEIGNEPLEKPKTA